ncbi:hypothetical protein FD04_GL001349 [Secundilactobacillus odoratitofui DSM 19909 = JCM 15043]|uniref:Uncharacterized protein n=1 Tax=Secundilactobacillus odoratitofui DSM 19909 = JCM 15043 TaxID=1423776 RepID=A0A0R1LNA0_9LACO|nr:hypothetical protein FD04_GL001349 [Secundilactobacillus odoratitofui DSM 19909 = JCM 15043]
MVKCLGITSACAENTPEKAVMFSQYLDHLRMCGEYIDASKQVAGNWGSPPHVRRIPVTKILQTERFGITSACAENTLSQTNGGRYT